MSVNLSELNLHVSHFQDCSVSNLLQNMKVNFLIFNHEWDPANREERPTTILLCMRYFWGYYIYTNYKVLITITITITREIENVNLFATFKIPLGMTTIFSTQICLFLPNQNVLNPSVGLTLVYQSICLPFFLINRQNSKENYD